MFTLRLLGIFILMAFVTPLSACATERTDLVETRAVKVQIEDTPKTSIRGVTVWADAEETIVYGRVRRLGVYDNPFFARQVTAKAVLPDGSTYEKADKLLRRTPRFESFKRIYPTADFKIVFPEAFPPGTTILLSFDKRANDQVEKAQTRSMGTGV